MIRILIFDDNPDFVDGISGLVAEAEGMELVGAYKNCKNVVRNVQHHQPDVVLMRVAWRSPGNWSTLTALKTWCGPLRRSLSIRFASAASMGLP